MSWSLLRPSLPIDRDELDWQLATFKWMIAEFGPVAGRPLVLPRPAFFPASQRKGHERVEDLFGQVKHLAGMADWPCALRPGRETRPTQAGNTHLLRHEGAQAPCGTFQVSDEDGAQRVVITYNPSLAADTDAMIATFAHELGHYLMSKAQPRRRAAGSSTSSTPIWSRSASASGSSSPIRRATSASSITRPRWAGRPRPRAI
jgi:hypothetical protein